MTAEHCSGGHALHQIHLLRPGEEEGDLRHSFLRLKDSVIADLVQGAAKNLLYLVVIFEGGRSAFHAKSPAFTHGPHSQPASCDQKPYGELLKSLAVYEVDLSLITVRPRFYVGSLSQLRLNQERPWNALYGIWSGMMITASCTSFALHISIDDKLMIMFPLVLADSKPFVLVSLKSYSFFAFTCDSEYGILLQGTSQEKTLSGESLRSCPITALACCPSMERYSREISSRPYKISPVEPRMRWPTIRMTGSAGIIL